MKPEKYEHDSFTIRFTDKEVEELKSDLLPYYADELPLREKQDISASTIKLAINLVMASSIMKPLQPGDTPITVVNSLEDAEKAERLRKLLEEAAANHETQVLKNPAQRVVGLLWRRKQAQGE